MKSVVSIFLVGMILFALSAGVSSMLLFKQWNVPETAEEVETKDEDPLKFPPAIEEESMVPEMPVALRPDVPLTVEAVTELAQSIMKKQKELAEAKERLKKEEKRIKLLFEDLRQEREELSAFGKRIDNKVTQAQEAVEMLRLENQSLVENQKALSKLEKKTGRKAENLASDEMDNRVDALKGMFKRFDANESAKYLREMANRGDLKVAAGLLGSLDDREKAKVFVALGDVPLGMQIIDTYIKDLKPEESNRIRSLFAKESFSSSAFK